MGDDRTFDWTIVEDDTAGDDVEGGAAGVFETDDDNDPVDEPRRARNVRRLLMACVLGGVVILALGVIGTLVVLNELDRTTSRERLTNSVHDRYQARYYDCVTRVGGAGTCSAQITQQCANDAAWTPKDVDELADVCTFDKGD